MVEFADKHVGRATKNTFKNLKKIGLMKRKIEIQKKDQLEYLEI